MLKLFLIILYLVCPFVLSAQSLMHVRYYSAKDGLSQNTVADFLQDDKGYIWMATWNGLEKFDGYTFTNYFHDESDSTSIACNYINKVYSDSHQRLWVASNKGIQYYLPQQNAFRTIKLPVNSYSYTKRSCDCLCHS